MNDSRLMRLTRQRTVDMQSTWEKVFEYASMPLHGDHVAKAAQIGTRKVKVGQ